MLAPGQPRACPSTRSNARGLLWEGGGYSDSATIGSVVTRLLPHTADLSVEVEAPTKRALFSEFARALTDLMVEGEVRPSHQEVVSLSAADPLSLLVRFLNELIFLWEDRYFLTGDIRFTEWKRLSLQAVFLGEPFSPDRHRVSHGVKAATYHQLQLVRIGRVWRGQVLFDV